jgi:hypothetical protein
MPGASDAHERLAAKSGATLTHAVRHLVILKSEQGKLAARVGFALQIILLVCPPAAH